MPSPLAQLLAADQQQSTGIPTGMGPGNAGYQPSGLEQLSMMSGLKGAPQVMRGEVPMGPGGMASLSALLKNIGSGVGAAAPVAEDVFSRGLRNQAQRGSLLSAEQLQAAKDVLFRKGVR